MNNWILLKTSRIKSDDSYNIVEMKFLNNTGNNKSEYDISFKILFENDRAERILEEFNKNIGYVDNVSDFITSINLFMKKNPRWLSIGFDRRNQN